MSNEEQGLTQAAGKSSAPRVSMKFWAGAASAVAAMVVVYGYTPADVQPPPEPLNCPLVPPAPPGANAQQIANQKMRQAASDQNCQISATFPSNRKEPIRNWDNWFTGDKPMTATVTDKKPGAAGAVGSPPDTPSEAQIKQALERHLSENASGLVRLNGFAKKDGTSMEVHGVKLYEMDWVANLEILNDCWLKLDSLEAKAASTVPQNEEILMAGTRHRQYTKGQRIDLSSKSSLKKSESGWRVTSLVEPGFYN